MLQYIKLIAAVGEEVVHGNAIVGAGIDTLTVDSYIGEIDIVAGRTVFLPFVAEAFRNLKNAIDSLALFRCFRWVAFYAAYELLFQQRMDLGAGQCHRHQVVTERKHVKCFGVGDLTVSFSSRSRLISQIGSDGSGVDKGYHGRTEFCAVCCGQTGVGHYVA